MRKPAVLLLLVLAACGGGEEAPPAAPAVPVALAEVRRDSLVVTLEADARLTSPPGGAALLAAPADAMVQEVLVAPGSDVSAGALVISLDAPDLAAAAHARRAEARTAQADAARQRALVAEGIASRRQAEERESAAQALEAEAAAAESLLARTRVRSPLGGVVARVLVHTGERVAAGQALAEVVRPGDVVVSATVPAAELAALRAGQPGQLRLEGQDQTWPVRLTSVGPVVDSLSNTATVLFRPLRADQQLRPGLAGQVRVQTAVHRGVLLVPASALVYVGNTPTIYVVGTDSIARARAVEPGARGGDDLEVRGPLREGEQVVTTGAYGLPDSARVLPQPAAAP